MEAACLKVTETHDEADTVGSRVPGLLFEVDGTHEVEK
jgi:hypothetical protein